MTGIRVESYIHSDSVTPNKGGSLIELHCSTDFAAKTPEFAAFAKEVAKHVYGAQRKLWAEIIDVFPELENKRKALSLLLKEEVYLAGAATFPWTKLSLKSDDKFLGIDVSDIHNTAESLIEEQDAMDEAVREGRCTPIPDDW
jgi:hypothetical protein